MSTETMATLILVLKIISIGIYPVLEYFLGKTDSGSLLGVILQGIVKILNTFGVGKKDQPQENEKESKR